jgi:hypothetical protein
MSDTLKNMKILLPMIRNLMPKVIAQEIVGVQPMDFPKDPKWKVVTEYVETVPDGYVVVDANKEISVWIEEQALHMWKHGELSKLDILRPGFYDRYIISEELLSWLTLRWS